MFQKKLLIPNPAADGKPVPVTIGPYTEHDFAQLIDIQRECFPPPFPSELWWNEVQLREHVTRFPLGALCAEAEGRLIGSMTGLIVHFDPAHAEHTWAEITDNGYIRNHDDGGNTLYIVDISVRPSSRGLGIGKWMMQTMYELVVQLKLERLLGGGRMSGYHRVADEMTAEQYAEAVVDGRLRDPVISFLLRCGRMPVKVVPGYLEDEESRNYAMLMEWRNPFYEMTKKSVEDGVVEMEYIRIQSINSPWFRPMHEMMGKVFPPEEVLDFELWAEPLEDPGIRVFVAVEDGQVVGATEYRYYPKLQVAMTDFTIIGREGLGIGPFLAEKRKEDLLEVVRTSGGRLLGMFAEIYNPYKIEQHAFGGVKPMDPFVRREVLAHLGYRRLELDYVHPSWQGDGEGVFELDLCFLPFEGSKETISAELAAEFLRTYYAVLPNKPQAWHEMVDSLTKRGEVRLLPI